MDPVVCNTVRFLSILLEDAVRMASETPAEILSLSENGRVASGADADLVILNAEGVHGTGDYRGRQDPIPQGS
jgi:N-acetylglucosamine-6-phosphate deacetylase